MISEEGSRAICERVLRRVIRAEADASHDSNRELARIDLVNYDLELLETQTADGRTFYVLALESEQPRSTTGVWWRSGFSKSLTRCTNGPGRRTA